MDRSSLGGILEVRDPVTKGALLADELNKKTAIQEFKFTPGQSWGKTNAGQQPCSACLLPSQPAEPFCAVPDPPAGTAGLKER